jgi:hypothetical protein
LYSQPKLPFTDLVVVDIPALLPDGLQSLVARLSAAEFTDDEFSVVVFAGLYHVVEVRWLTVIRKVCIGQPTFSFLLQAMLALNAAGATLIEEFTVFVPPVHAEWGSPPIAGRGFTALRAKVSKSSTVVRDPEKITAFGGHLQFQPACSFSKSGRPGMDALVVEKGKPVCAEQLPIECLRCDQTRC